MGPIRCPQTWVKDYHSTLRNTPEERRCHHHRGASLKSRTAFFCLQKKRSKWRFVLRSYQVWVSLRRLNILTDIRDFPQSLLKEYRHCRTLKITDFLFDPSPFTVGRPLNLSDLIACIRVYLVTTEHYKSAYYRVLLPLFLKSKYSPQHCILKYSPVLSLGVTSY
jgi:hypothetical protein